MRVPPMNARHLIERLYELRLRLDQSEPDGRCEVYADIDAATDQLCKIAKIDSDRVRRFIDQGYPAWAKQKLLDGNGAVDI